MKQYKNSDVIVTMSWSQWKKKWKNAIDTNSICNTYIFISFNMVSYVLYIYCNVFLKKKTLTAAHRHNFQNDIILHPWGFNSSQQNKTKSDLISVYIMANKCKWVGSQHFIKYVYYLDYI